jgi:hypothetical protein
MRVRHEHATSVQLLNWGVWFDFIHATKIVF